MEYFGVSCLDILDDIVWQVLCTMMHLTTLSCTFLGKREEHKAVINKVVRLVNENVNITNIVLIESDDQSTDDRDEDNYEYDSDVDEVRGDELNSELLELWNRVVVPLLVKNRNRNIG